MGFQTTSSRGPASFFAEETYPIGYQIRKESKDANPVPARRSAGPAFDIARMPQLATSDSPPQTKRKGRVCVMCDHYWLAEFVPHRNDILKCPNCGSSQPGDAELTTAELREMARKCKKARQEEADLLKCKMRDASQRRSAMKKRGYLSEDSLRNALRAVSPQSQSLSGL